MDNKKSCGFVALLGEPNAGKSTLLNYMVGTKISIVTHKVQTTRRRIRGVSILGDSQIIFIDTPGLFQPKRRLDRAMVKAAWSGAVDSDVIVFLIEANRGVTSGVKENLKKLREFKDFPVSVAVAINKIDRVKSEELLKLTKEINEEYEFEKTFLISAKKGHGVNNLKEWLAEKLPIEDVNTDWLFPLIELVVIVTLIPVEEPDNNKVDAGVALLVLYDAVILVNEEDAFIIDAKFVPKRSVDELICTKNSESLLSNKEAEITGT